MSKKKQNIKIRKGTVSYSLFTAFLSFGAMYSTSKWIGESYAIMLGISLVICVASVIRYNLTKRD